MAEHTPGTLRQLGAVIHAVEELDSVAEWYEQVLGMKPSMRTSTFVGFDLGGHWLGFDTEPLLGEPSASPSSITYWKVTDIFSAFARFVNAGARPRGSIHGLEDVKFAVVIDPWGNPLGLMEGEPVGRA